MIKRLLLIGLLSVFVSGCVTTSRQQSAAVQAGEFVPHATALLGPAKVGSGGSSGPLTVLEFIPQDQEIGNWKKLVTVLIASGVNQDRYASVLQQLGQVESDVETQPLILKKVHKTHKENTPYGTATYTEFSIESTVASATKEDVVSYVWPIEPKKGEIAKISLQKRGGDLTAQDLANFKTVINTLKHK